jgi:hypothetical protein
MLGEMEADYNRGHFDRKAPLDRLQQAGRPELSRLFNLLIRCWPGLRQGWCGHILSRFFLWSVFLPHSLSVCERGEFYQLLGMDPARFDAEVMRHTKGTVRRAFPWVFHLFVAICVARPAAGDLPQPQAGAWPAKFGLRLLVRCQNPLQ